MKTTTTRVRSLCLPYGILFSFLLAMPLFTSPLLAQEKPLLQQFQTPPSGYGEVPFYWWSGDKITKDRLIWQLDELKAKGLSGVQVNYAHQPRRIYGGGGHGMTYPQDPAIFSREWWELWRFAADACAERGMGIGLGDYTLAWAGNKQWVDEMIVDYPEIVGQNLRYTDTLLMGGKHHWRGLKDVLYMTATTNTRAKAEIDLLPNVRGGVLEVELPQGSWQVQVVQQQRVAKSINPLHPETGKRFIEKYFQRFEDNSTNKNSAGLNYFFQDELMFGVKGILWSDDFADEFMKKKGYDIRPKLPSLFVDINDETPKVRLDYYDVMVALSEAYYFKPVFEWHEARGMIYGCDQNSRGLEPAEYGDYFRTIRWFTAPGHDTPGIGADLIKGKVSSSIAHLYHRPRVWLEGYHSAGWGTTTETLMRATCENYIFGCNLLCLHGLYYSTFGSMWEWAPPCYHFRMPYWNNMASWLKYFERLSYLMSQGTHRCDVAMLYPVEPSQTEIMGDEAIETAFEAGRLLYPHGIDFDFIDFQSVSRAAIEGSQLHVSGEQYQAVVVPNMSTLRFETVNKLLTFWRKGGTVVFLESLPVASDRVGRNDEKMTAAWKEILGTAHPAASVVNKKQGTGAFLQSRNELAAFMKQHLSRDFAPAKGTDAGEKLYVNHRIVDNKDIYMVMYAKEGGEYTFKTEGAPQLWDPWTGLSRPLNTYRQTAEGVCVKLPPIKDHIYLLVFDKSKDNAPSVAETKVEEITDLTPSADGVKVSALTSKAGTFPTTVEWNGATYFAELKAKAPSPARVLDGDWNTALIPTMDNQWGDYFQPASPDTIGAQARRVCYATTETKGWESPGLDESTWAVHSVGYAPRMNLLLFDDSTLVNEATDREILLSVNNRLKATTIRGEAKSWQPYSYSLRFGKEFDFGYQGYHGTKAIISNDFLVLPRASYACGYLHAEKETAVQLAVGTLKPDRVWVNGHLVSDLNHVTLKAGANTVLASFSSSGRSRLLARDLSKKNNYREYPLSMDSYLNRALIPFDASAEQQTEGYYRLVAPPGAERMKIALYGTPTFYHNGQPCRSVVAKEQREDGSQQYEILFASPMERSSTVAIHIKNPTDNQAGAAITEYIDFVCGKSVMPLGDWTKIKGLEYYSGGISYEKRFRLSSEELAQEVTLDLGSVVASCEVWLNDQKVGELTASPWQLNLSKEAKEGENRLRLVVYNTLAPHYQTIATEAHFRGNPESGIIQPAKLTFRRPVETEAK